MVYLSYIYEKGEPKDFQADALIILIGKQKDKPVLPKDIDRLAGGLIEKIIEKGDFKGNEGEVRKLIPPSDKYDRIFLAGIGESPTLETIRVTIANVINKVLETNTEKAVLYLKQYVEKPLSEEKVLEQVIIATEMTMYDPGQFFKSKEKKEWKLKEILILSSKEIDDADKIVERASKIADAVNYARRIADTPSSMMNPEKIEEEARKLAEEYGLEIKVLHYEDLKRLGLNGIIAVGSGGGVPPRLIILEYRGRNGDDWDIAFVGKTVTFDAGGLNLKPTGYIDDMKYDKSGGAAVLGIIKAAASLKLPLNIVAALPAVENLPGPKAYKPKDIIKMYNGMTIEVNNTDAEGRIILADALSYIEKNYKPKEIFDLATLTGAIVVALGNYAAGLFTQNDRIAEKLVSLADITGEKVWRMPLWKEYYEQLRSEFADTSNIGGRPAGAITAAAFLSKFLEKPENWVHLDIAGTAWVQKGHPKKPYYRQAATGFGVRLLIYYLLDSIGML